MRYRDIPNSLNQLPDVPAILGPHSDLFPGEIATAFSHLADRARITCDVCDATFQLPLVHFEFVPVIGIGRQSDVWAE